MQDEIISCVTLGKLLNVSGSSFFSSVRGNCLTCLYCIELNEIIPEGS